ncbi:hypothetical protein V3C99_019093 [Haemonchus contortus]|uniref:Uncharacterized protein n=1 Tax=Haemonchus contortus TaxID=6289 RepID=A0A7I4Z2Q2_HAECO
MRVDVMYDLGRSVRLSSRRIDSSPTHIAQYTTILVSKIRWFRLKARRSSSDTMYVTEYPYKQACQEQPTLKPMSSNLQSRALHSAPRGLDSKAGPDNI